VRALVVEGSLVRFAAARAASAVAPGRALGAGPLRLLDVDAPDLPGEGWKRVRPRLSGICGSDLSTLQGHSSRYFAPLVSFPFVPGHEVVGEVVGQHGARVVLQPVLGCAARGITPPCRSCAEGLVGGCERVAFGHLEPGLQTGYCADTGGGWSGSLVAHESQLHPVPATMSDEEAVMVEPAACAVHAVLRAAVEPGETVVVSGAGTLGLCTVAALRHLALPGTVIASAKHPEQRDLAEKLGADAVVAPGELRRAVRRHTRSLAVGGRLTGGADLVVDCVGSAESVDTSLSVVRPRGRVLLLGMPGVQRLDLAPLWHREVCLVGSYTYGREERPGGAVATFDVAFELVAEAGLGRLVSARYPLERFEEAIAHAANAGRRGSVKVVFDLVAGPPIPRTTREAARARRPA
jgi:threonine dehydrogenase-like Zn-dependent dehydrogenase